MLPKEITSLQHPIVKKCVELRTVRKTRYEEKKVVIVGIKEVSEAENLEVLFVKKGVHYSVQAKEIYIVDDPILKKITEMETPEPFAAIVPMPAFQNLTGKKWILGLDRVSDPGNMGNLLRTALALGWEGVFLSEDCVDPYNEKTIRSARGALFRIPMRMGKVEEFIPFAQSEKLAAYVADMDGKPLNAVGQISSAFLILGNEAQGVSLLLKKSFDSVSIPISSMESLNVAAAGAILMYNLKHE